MRKISRNIWTACFFNNEI